VSNEIVVRQSIGCSNSSSSSRLQASLFRQSPATNCRRTEKQKIEYDVKHEKRQQCQQNKLRCHSHYVAMASIATRTRHARMRFVSHLRQAYQRMASGTNSTMPLASLLSQFAVVLVCLSCCTSRM